MANFFKIINITSSLPKRHPKKDMTLDIKYGDGYKTAVKKLPAGSEMFIICDKLPTNIQKLSLEKLVIVNRVTQNEYKRKIKKPIKTQKHVGPKINLDKSLLNKPEEPTVKVIEEKVEEKPKRQYRRKSSSKKKTEEKFDE